VGPKAVLDAVVKIPNRRRAQGNLFPSRWTFGLDITFALPANTFSTSLETSVAGLACSLFWWPNYTSVSSVTRWKQESRPTLSNCILYQTGIAEALYLAACIGTQAMALLPSSFVLCALRCYSYYTDKIATV